MQTIIDAHAHCGRQDRFPPQDLADYTRYLGGSGIQAAVMFPPVMEIYDRYDPGFRDTEDWKERRAAANEYLLDVGNPRFKVHPYFFIWNDFAVDQITDRHKGIKWHRHPDEPVYEYSSSLCAKAIEEIRRRNMPVCLEEEFENTLFFINELAAGIKVIIPHCGLLNGGYELFKRHKIWERPNIYADTALAPSDVIRDYLLNYSHERLMFGSDFPFGDPAAELHKVVRLKLPLDQLERVVGLNVAELLEQSNC